MSRFLSPLRAELIRDDDGRRRANWKLIDDLAYMSDLVGKMVVPAGFTTDFASVPRFVLTWLIAGGVGNEPSTLHDFCYRNGMFPRATCDLLFKEALLVCRVSSWRAQAMYLAVRLVGGVAGGYKRAVHRRAD